MRGEHVSLLFIQMLLYQRVRKKACLLYESATVERHAVLNMQEARQQLCHTLPLPSPSAALILPFFFLKNKMERGAGWIAIIGVSLYAVIYTIKWQHIETNL